MLRLINTPKNQQFYGVVLRDEPLYHKKLIKIGRVIRDSRNERLISGDIKWFLFDTKVERNESLGIKMQLMYPYLYSWFYDLRTSQNHSHITSFSKKTIQSQWLLGLFGSEEIKDTDDKDKWNYLKTYKKDFKDNVPTWLLNEKGIVSLRNYLKNDAMKSLFSYFFPSTKEDKDPQDPSHVFYTDAFDLVFVKQGRKRDYAAIHYAIKVLKERFNLVEENNDDTVIPEWLIDTCVKIGNVGIDINYPNLTEKMDFSNVFYRKTINVGFFDAVLQRRSTYAVSNLDAVHDELLYQFLFLLLVEAWRILESTSTLPSNKLQSNVSIHDGIAYVTTQHYTLETTGILDVNELAVDIDIFINKTPPQKEESTLIQRYFSTAISRSQQAGFPLLGVSRVNKTCDYPGNVYEQLCAVNSDVHTPPLEQVFDDAKIVKLTSFDDIKSQSLKLVQKIDAGNREATIVMLVTLSGCQLLITRQLIMCDIRPLFAVTEKDTLFGYLYHPLHQYFYSPPIAYDIDIVFDILSKQTITRVTLGTRDTLNHLLASARNTFMTARVYTTPSSSASPKEIALINHNVNARANPVVQYGPLILELKYLGTMLYKFTELLPKVLEFKEYFNETLPNDVTWDTEYQTLTIMMYDELLAAWYLYFLAKHQDLFGDFSDLVLKNIPFSFAFISNTQQNINQRHWIVERQRNQRVYSSIIDPVSIIPFTKKPKPLSTPWLLPTDPNRNALPDANKYNMDDFFAPIDEYYSGFTEWEMQFNETEFTFKEQPDLAGMKTSPLGAMEVTVALDIKPIFKTPITTPASSAIIARYCTVRRFVENERTMLQLVTSLGIPTNTTIGYITGQVYHLTQPLTVSTMLNTLYNFRVRDGDTKTWVYYYYLDEAFSLLMGYIIDARFYGNMLRYLTFSNDLLITNVKFVPRLSTHVDEKRYKKYDHLVYWDVVTTQAVSPYSPLIAALNWFN